MTRSNSPGGFRQADSVCEASLYMPHPATARAFWLHMGFVPSPTNPDTLLLQCRDVAEALRP